MDRLKKGVRRNRRPQPAVTRRLAIESLEDRRMLAVSATLGFGVLAITEAGGAASDQLSLRQAGTDLVLTAPTAIATNIVGATGGGTTTVRIPLALVTLGQVIVDLGEQSDSLTVDYAGGFFLFDVTYFGGNGTGDSLRITGGLFDTVTHNLTTASTGILEYMQGASSATLSYSGLEPVDMSGSTITDLVFNLPGLADNPILEDDGVVGNNVSRLRSRNGTFETTTFGTPQSVTLNLGGDAATLTVGSIPDFHNSLEIDGQAGADSVQFQGTVSLSSAGATLTVLSAQGGISDLAGTTLLSNGATKFDGGGGAIVLGDSPADVTTLGTLDITAGTVTLSEETQIFLGSLSATTATLVAGTDITDPSNSNINVSGLATLTAGNLIQLGNIVTDTVNFGSFQANAISVLITEDSNMTVNSVTATGIVNLIAADDILLAGLIRSLGGTVLLTSQSGSIFDENSGTDIETGSLGLRAPDGIGEGGTFGELETVASRLAFQNTSSAQVQVVNTGALIVEAFANVTDLVAVAGGFVRTNSPLTIASEVTLGGDFTFTANDSAATGDDLTIADGVIITGILLLGDVDVTFNAGDRFLFSSTATIKIDGDVIVEGDFNDADAEGSAIALLGDLQADSLTANGGNDNDTFTVVPGTSPITINGNNPVAGDPGVPPGDRLILSLPAGVTLDNVPTLPNGTAMLTGADDIDFTSIEDFDVISPDFLEDNDTLATASVLGSDPFVSLTNLSIHSPTDVDFFKYTAHDTGKLIVRTLFDHAIGDLDLEVQDMFGNVIDMSMTSSATTGFEEIILPVVGQEMYFVRVFGAGGAVNNYALEIENFPAPVPERPELHPDDDNGTSNTDNITDVVDPRIFIQADLADVAAMGITILTPVQAAAGLTAGAAVEVFINGVSQGFASAVGASNTLFSFRLESDTLAAGLPIAGGTLNFITAAVRVFDGQLDALAGNPARQSGRSQLSEPLELRTVDTSGLQVESVIVTGSPNYNLFDPKPTTGPTPLVNSLTVEFAPTYDVATSVPFVYEDISATGTEVVFGNVDDGSAQFNLGFQFPFFDQVFGSVFVNTNGILTFGSAFTVSVNSNLTQASTVPTQPAIAPLWDDWDIDTAFPGRVFVQTLGTAGNDLRLVVQWKNVEHFNANGVDGTVDFEAVLFQNGTIEFRYNDTITGDAANEDNGISATVGIRAAEPSAVVDGDVHQISFNQSVITAGRAIRFSSPFDPAQATNTGNYRLVGDANGNVLIQSATVVAPNKVQLNFARPLPDDRFTFTIFDSLTDLAGNPLDGESQAAAPGGAAQLPSGNGVPGGDFEARFTVDTRPEIGVWAAGIALVDTNGNFHFDPENVDFTNRDIIYHLGFAADNIFAGNFAADGPDNLFGTPDDTTAAAGDGLADGFDKLAAYGRVGNQWRWMIDTDNNGVPNLVINEPLNINGKPIAGNFDGNVTNGDEVGVFTGTRWFFDTNHDYQLDAASAVTVSDYQGYPMVGDFDGDGDDDVGVYTAVSNKFAGNLFEIDLNTAAAGMPISINGAADHTFRVGFPALAAAGGFNGFPGVRERPVAADMNADGFADIGLWVPDGTALVPGDQGEWFFLISSGKDDTTTPLINEASVLGRIDNGFVSYTPTPFGNDLYARFGNSFAVPLVGNFDPPATLGASIATSPAQTTETANALPVSTQVVITTTAVALESQPAVPKTEEPAIVPTVTPVVISVPIVAQVIVILPPAPVAGATEIKSEEAPVELAEISQSVVNVISLAVVLPVENPKTPEPELGPEIAAKVADAPVIVEVLFLESVSSVSTAQAVSEVPSVTTPAEPTVEALEVPSATAAAVTEIVPPASVLEVAAAVSPIVEAEPVFRRSSRRISRLQSRIASGTSAVTQIATASAEAVVTGEQVAALSQTLSAAAPAEAASTQTLLSAPETSIAPEATVPSSIARPFSRRSLMLSRRSTPEIAPLAAAAGATEAKAREAAFAHLANRGEETATLLAEDLAQWHEQ